MQFWDSVGLFCYFYLQYDIQQRKRNASLVGLLFFFVKKIALIISYTLHSVPCFLEMWLCLIFGIFCITLFIVYLIYTSTIPLALVQTLYVIQRLIFPRSFSFRMHQRLREATKVLTCFSSYAVSRLKTSKHLLNNVFPQLPQKDFGIRVYGQMYFILFIALIVLITLQAHINTKQNLVWTKSVLVKERLADKFKDCL